MEPKRRIKGIANGNLLLIIEVIYLWLWLWKPFQKVNYIKETNGWRSKGIRIKEKIMTDNIEDDVLDYIVGRQEGESEIILIGIVYFLMV